MDIKIDEIVKQVLSEIDAPSRPVQPKTTFVLEETSTDWKKLEKQRFSILGKII